MATAAPQRLPRDAEHRLVAVTIDEAALGAASGNAEHERAIAIYDLIEDNHFAVPRCRGPYRLHISIAASRLVFSVADEAGEPVVSHLLSLRPFRRVVRDYFMLCESYYAAIRSASPSQIEAIDMGRRGLHDEAAALLIERLGGKIETDFATARRLFTLLAALHWKG
jgi:uncharacterized protein (UPF0262 family)